MKKFLAILAVASILISPALSDGELEQGLLKLPIVMYHHLSPKPRLLGDYVLSPDQLEKDLIYLRDNGYESVTIGELISWSKGEAELPAKPVMITFDDGYESTLVYARPLLEQYGFRAVVAIVGSVADLFTEKPDHMLDYSHLSWDAVRQISTDNIFEIQCHTYAMHQISGRKGCGQVSGEAFGSYKSVLSADLIKFREKCEVENVTCANSIAFPYGIYSRHTLSIVRELEFDAAFTCVERVNYLERDPEALFELCRYNRPHGPSSENFFEKWR